MQVVNESGDMERLDLGELVKVFGSAPIGEAAGGVQIEVRTRNGILSTVVRRETAQRVKGESPQQ